MPLGLTLLSYTQLHAMLKHFFTSTAVYHIFTELNFTKFYFTVTVHLTLLTSTALYPNLKHFFI